MHPSKGPNYVALTPKLECVNYLAWTCAMCRALGAKNKFKFVNRSITFPGHGDPNHQEWE